MMKKLLLPILAIYLFTHSVGCTSNDTQDDNPVAGDDSGFKDETEEDFADGGDTGGDDEGGDDEGGDDGTDVAGTDGDDSGDGGDEGGDGAGDEGGDVAGGDEGGGDIANDPDAGGGEEPTEDGTDVAANGDEPVEGDEDSEFPEDVADETEPGTNVAGGSEPTDQNLFTSPSGDPAPVEPEPPVVRNDPPQTQPSEDIFRPTTTRFSGGGVGYAGLQKIKDAPFERGGALLNRVYLARQGDTLKGVSEKIYGTDRSKDLRKWNPGLRNKPNIGEKIYYNSPSNPTDSAQMLTFYEDKGVAPQVYTTKAGDNIRTLGKALLGATDSWKELWSTNMDVASKAALPAGLELKYWPAGSAPVATTPIVATQPQPAEPLPTALPPAGGTNPAGGTPVAGNDPMALPPAGGDAGNMPPNPDEPFNGDPTTPPVAGTTDPTVPPPDPGTVAPPPQPEPVKPQQARNRDTAQSTADDDTTLMVGVAGVLLLLLVGVFVILKKKSARRIDLSQTQV